MKSSVISARMDLRDLQALVAFYHNQGNFPRTRSAVVAMSLRYLVSILEQDGKIVRMDSPEEAEAWLQQYAGSVKYIPASQPIPLSSINLAPAEVGTQSGQDTSDEEMQKLVWDTLKIPEDQRILPTAEELEKLRIETGHEG